MKKSINSKRLKAIKALADRGIDGEKENAQRLYKELSQKNKKAPDTEEIKNAKKHILNKIELMCVGRMWDDKTLKSMLRVRFKVSVNQVDDINMARDMYAHLNWLEHMIKGKEYRRKVKVIDNN